MSRLTVTKAREELSDVVNKVSYRGERIILRRRGKDVAALVSMADLAQLEALEDRLDGEAVKAAEQELADGKTVPWADVKAKHGL